MPNLPSVSDAEVESFKLQRGLEREFLSKLNSITRELSAKVGKSNRLVASMDRFLRNNPY